MSMSVLVVHGPELILFKYYLYMYFKSIIIMYICSSIVHVHSVLHGLKSTIQVLHVHSHIVHASIITYLRV